MTMAPQNAARRTDARDGLVQSTMEHLWDFGPRETFLAAMSKVMTVSAGPVLRRRTPPTLAQLHAVSRAVHLRPEEAARDLIGERAGVSLERITAEYEVVRQRLHDAYGRHGITYPSDRRVGGGSAFFVYALIRGFAPRTVLETGIANGHSTFVILSALEQNGVGRLVSVDVDASTGSLLADLDKSRWDQRVLDESHRRRSFQHLVSTLEEIDLFLHDSDHTYRWQRVEYETVHPRMAASSLMLSDDVDASRAFLEFCQSIGRQPTLLVETRKVFGVVTSGSRAMENHGPPPAAWDE